MAVGETETPIIGQVTERAYGFKSNKCKVRVPNMEDVYSKEETFGRMELRFIHSVYPYSSPSITIDYPEGMDASTTFVMSASAYTRVNGDEVTLTPINISQITLKASGILINPASPANCIDLILAIRSAAPVVQ